MPFDLVLSSGFLAFARHAGVLAAIESRGVDIDAVVGTSSGALTGALWSAGISADEIADTLASIQPYSLMGLHAAPWRGLFSLDPLIGWLSERLPATFADLPRPFAVGVVAPDGQARLLTEGPLAPAVAASCAMPYVFKPVMIGGEALRDGGAVDRLMLDPWRAWRRGARPALVHLVARSAGRDIATLDDLPVIHTPRSGASFFSLGDVRASVALARQLAEPVLDTLPRAADPGAAERQTRSPAHHPAAPSSDTTAR